MALKMQVDPNGVFDPGLGLLHKSTAVYSRELSAVEVARAIGNHNWAFGNAPAHQYRTIVGSVVDKKSKSGTAACT